MCCSSLHQKQAFCAGWALAQGELSQPAPSQLGGGGKSPWMEASDRLNIHVSAGKLQQALVTNCYPNCLHP